MVLSEAENGKLFGGIILQYLQGKTKTNSYDYADGEISTDGYGFGGKLTCYNDNGFYIDDQAQVTWYKSELTITALSVSVLSDSNKKGSATQSRWKQASTLRLTQNGQ